MARSYCELLCDVNALQILTDSEEYSSGTDGDDGDDDECEKPTSRSALPSHHPLPEPFDLDMYGAASIQIICWLAAGKEMPRLKQLMATMLILLLLSVAMQTSVLACVMLFLENPAIAKMAHIYADFVSAVYVDGIFSFSAWDEYDGKGELCKYPAVQPHFIFLVLLIWSMACSTELESACTQCWWWWALPQCKNGDATLERSGYDIILTEASARLKTVICVVTFVPKVFIAASLWWLGVRWLIATPKAIDILTNVVALSFVVDLDKMIYNVMIPQHSKTWFTRFKMAVPELQGDGKSRLCKLQTMIIGQCLIVCIIPYIYLKISNHVLPVHLPAMQEACSLRFADDGS